MDNAETQWKYDFYDQLTNAVRSGSPNGAADAAYNFGYKYDQVGNRLHEDRGQLDLNGTFNNLNQLQRLGWSGKLDVFGSSSSTNVKVAGLQAAIYNGSNYLGGATMLAGSNTIPIVAWSGTNATETNRTVYMPPANPEPCTWDLNGNMTSDGQRTLTWDNENRFVSIETGGTAAPPSAKRRSEYQYDAQSRRIQRKDLSTWNGSAYATTNTTRFIWDNWLLLSEIQVSGLTSQVSTNWNVWGLDLSQSLQGAGGIGGLLATVSISDPEPVERVYTFDGNGNVSDVLNGSGSVVAHYEFDPFGRTVSQSGSFVAQNRWRFSTKEIEAFWNLYYYGYRFYSANLHIFLSRDPVLEKSFHIRKSKEMWLSKNSLNASMANIHASFLNNPINFRDPLGLCTITLSLSCNGRNLVQNYTTTSDCYDEDVVFTDCGAMRSQNVADFENDLANNVPYAIEYQANNGDPQNYLSPTRTPGWIEGGLGSGSDVSYAPTTSDDVNLMCVRVSATDCNTQEETQVVKCRICGNGGGAEGREVPPPTSLQTP